MINIVDAIEGGNIIRPLSRSEEWSLHPDRRTSESGQRLLQKLNENKEYLRCDCRQPSAMMQTSNYSAHGYGYRLVNHSRYGLHHGDCPFYREVQGWVVSNPEAAQRALSRQEQTFPTLELYGAFANESTKKVSKSDNAVTRQRSAKSGRRVDKIVNLVWFLVKQSHQDRFDSSEPKIYEEEALKRFQQAGKNTAFGDSTLDKWIFFGPRAFYQARDALVAIREKQGWQSGGRPHAFVAMVVDEVEIDDENKANRKVILKKDERDTPYYVHSIKTDGQGVRTPGPYLVFMSLCEYEKGGAFRAHTVYIKPILYANRLMLMDSDHERKFARQVIRKIQGCPGWTFGKPLEGKVIEDTFLMPDFLLENPTLNIRHLVEIMGMLNDPDYADRKEYIVPLMSKAWTHHEVVEIDPVSPSTDKRDYLEQLARLCCD
ncbi:hypothetical protein ACN3E9_11155 [Vibrio pectenicida]|uniref:hypothetical protein n=1 Tax=Vibrio pectenicida TaxID=62763 RepID=UPI003B9CF801